MYYARPLKPRVSVTTPEDFTEEGSLDPTGMQGNAYRKLHLLGVTRNQTIHSALVLTVSTDI